MIRKEVEKETKDRRGEEIMKKQKGITLIALVVTIIVLLILAGVTLVTLMGENGLLSMAEKSAEETEISKEKEIVGLSYQQAKLENGNKISKDKLQNALNGFAGESKTAIYTDEEDYYIEFKESGRVYKIDKDGKVTVEESDILTADKTPRTARWRRNTRQSIYNNEH